MPAPLNDNNYGSPDEEGQRLFRKLRGVLPGTRVGIPGRPDGYPKNPAPPNSKRPKKS